MALDNDLLSLWLAAADFDREGVRRLIEHVQDARQQVYDADALLERVKFGLQDMLIDADRISSGDAARVTHGLNNIYDIINGLLDELEARGERDAAL